MTSDSFYFRASRGDLVRSVADAYQHQLGFLNTKLAQAGAPADWTCWHIENVDMAEIIAEAAEDPAFCEMIKIYDDSRKMGSASIRLTHFGLAGVSAAGAIFQNVSFKETSLNGDFRFALFEQCDLREIRSGLEGTMEGARLVNPKLTISQHDRRRGAEILNPEFYTPKFNYPGGGERVYGWSETPEGHAIYKPTLSERFSNIMRKTGAGRALRYHNDASACGVDLDRHLAEALRGLPEQVVRALEGHLGRKIDDGGTLKASIAEEAELSCRMHNETPEAFLRKTLPGYAGPNTPN
jgi:hypothetical protein